MEDFVKKKQEIQESKKKKVIKPKMSMGLELIDDENLNYEVEIVYAEMYGISPKEAVFADMLP